MSMMRFGRLFPDLAEEETRSLIVVEPGLTWGPLFLPADEYGFDELYCAERNCDCRRVLVNVLARYRQQHLATINHAFEEPAEDAHLPEQTFLDPLNPQSRWAPALLDVFENRLLADERYRERLVRHYHMFKRAVEDPAHPCHRLVPEDGWSTPPARPESVRQAPPRRFKRRTTR